MTGAPHRSAPPRLLAENVTFGYGAARPVLERFSAAFAPGTMTALTGPSGRGKSTLLYLLGLMLRPGSGEIRVAGESTTAMRDAQLATLRAETFGFVFQDAALDGSRTVLDNVTETALYRGASRAAVTGRAAELLDAFGVDVAPRHKPGQVSGGQAQRIALCRALLHSPRILLADEPTGNLDPASARLVMTALHAHCRTEAAVIVVTHSPEVAGLCDAEIRL